MLTYFEITNFRSLEHIKFNLAPNKSFNKSNISIIFGTNASGKTTVIEAIEFFKDVICAPASARVANLTFAGSKNKVICIKAYFRINGDMYYYENHLIVNEDFIESELEKLAFKKFNEKKEIILFENNTRVEDSLVPDQNFAVSSYLLKAKISTEKQTFLKRFLFYVQNIKTISKGVETKIKDVAQKLMKDKSLKEQFIQLFSSLDLHIENTEERRYEFLNDQVKVNFKHNDLNQSLPAECESHGTIGLYVIVFYILESLKNKSLLLIDEIESALHHQIVELIIDSLQKKLASKKDNYPQFIFTSHKIELMKSLYSKENIFLTEKKDNGSTDLYCATDFESIKSVRDAYDKYKNNRLGANPVIDFKFDEIIQELYSKY